KSFAVNGTLTLLALLTAFPLLWMISASLMPAGEAMTLPARLVPSRPTLEHYETLFTRLDIGRTLLNTLFLASAVTAISLLCNSMAGYAFAKLRFRGRHRLFALLLATLIVPPQVTVLPLFLEIRALGLVNSYGGVIVAAIATVFGIFLIRQFAQGIPDELLDAARLDGASELRIYWTVVLPLLRPILVTLGVFTFLTSWNDFMWPLIVLTDESKYTLPVAIANLSGEHVLDTELMMAGAVVTVLPGLLLFLFLQRNTSKGSRWGASRNEAHPLAPSPTRTHTHPGEGEPPPPSLQISWEVAPPLPGDRECGWERGMGGEGPLRSAPPRSHIRTSSPGPRRFRRRLHLEIRPLGRRLPRSFVGRGISRQGTAARFRLPWRRGLCGRAQGAAVRAAGKLRAFLQRARRGAGQQL